MADSNICAHILQECQARDKDWQVYENAEARPHG
eukprot:COSAG02_NODE_2190_length_9560_cov_4.988166_8_plen_34_part_00